MKVAPPLAVEHGGKKAIEYKDKDNLDDDDKKKKKDDEEHENIINKVLGNLVNMMNIHNQLI